MNTHQTPASQTRDTVDPSSQDADNRTCLALLQVDTHIDDPHSHFPGSPPFPVPDSPSLWPLDPYRFYQLLPQQGTSSTLVRSSCPGPIEVDQAPDSLEMRSNYGDANTDDVAQTHPLISDDPLPFSHVYADPRPQYEQPNFPPPSQHAQRGLDPYGHPVSSSTTVDNPGFSLHAGFNEPPGLEGLNTGTAISSEQMPDAGPSLSTAQEQSPSLPYEEKLHAKKERDKIRKRNERSTNSQDYENICKLLKIELKPKKTLANRIFKAVEELVEQRDLYSDSQRRVKEAEKKVNIMKERVAQLEQM